MAVGDGPPIDWSGPLRWYMSADELIADLDTCCTAVQTLRTGSAEANVRAAEFVIGLAGGSPSWLRDHPCPEEWNAEYVGNIIQTFRSIGELIAGAGGVPPGSEPPSTRIDNACAPVDGAHRVNLRLFSEYVSQTAGGSSPRNGLTDLTKR